MGAPRSQRTRGLPWLGEVYAYSPSVTEVLVSVGVWGVGGLLFTLMMKVATAISAGELSAVSMGPERSP